MLIHFGGQVIGDNDKDDGGDGEVGDAHDGAGGQGDSNRENLYRRALGGHPMLGLAAPAEEPHTSSSL